MAERFIFTPGENRDEKISAMAKRAGISKAEVLRNLIDSGYEHLESTLRIPVAGTIVDDKVIFSADFLERE